MIRRTNSDFSPSDVDSEIMTISIKLGDFYSSFTEDKTLPYSSEYNELKLEFEDEEDFAQTIMRLNYIYNKYLDSKLSC